MSALRERAGWDLKALGNLPFMTFARKLEIEFLHPVVGDQETTIASFVREFSGPDAHVECSMTDERGSILSPCNSRGHRHGAGGSDRLAPAAPDERDPATRIRATSSTASF